nr:restriction endonuclease subunit S [Veillonella sp.]
MGLFYLFWCSWEQRKLGDIVDFLDGQRKPLKESERTKGKYPYYGASGIIDYISDYLFDENLVLLSEDGANIIDRNYPVCFIATGQYWVNNHAHVLKVKTGIIDKFICESLERLDYTKFNTGTAQPKLNQDICQKIVITIPNEDEQKYISEFLDRINNIITLHQQEPFLYANSVNGGVELCLQ